MTPEEITIQEMEKAIDIFKKEYRDYRNSLSSIFAKECERVTLQEIAKKMCAKGKGILAADESTGTIAKRFKSINVENIEKNRLNFRQTLFNSSAMKDFIGGVITIAVGLRVGQCLIDWWRSGK